MNKRKKTPAAPALPEPPPGPDLSTIEGCRKEYERQYTRHQQEYQAWYAAHPYVPGKPRKEQDHYDGFQIDYAGLTTALAVAVQNEYGFSAARAGAICGLAYEKGHSSFGDVFCYAYDYADFVKNLPD
jgi:hypothetical protein